MTSPAYVIRNELSTENLCSGFPFAEPRVFPATGTTQAVDAVRPNAGGERSARSLDRRVTIRK